MPPPQPNPVIATRLQRLRAAIDQIGSLAEVNLTLPGSGRLYQILRPTDTDLLLDRVVDDPEQNLPYWSEIWPSGIALADAIMHQPDLVHDRRVLEIGSGLGITAIAALAAGAQLTVADYAPESLLLCRYNTLRHTGREPATLQINWRHPEESLFALTGDGFPVILAADVLYEARDVDPLLALLARLVAPNGLLWLAEPGRPVATRFLAAAKTAGWHGTTETHPGPWPDPKDEAITVGLHLLRR